MGGMSEQIKDMLENQRYSEFEQVLQSAMDGGDPMKVLYLLATNQNLANGQNSYFDTLLQQILSRYNTQSARDYETNMANTDLLRAASQLSALGLSPSGVLQTGGSATPNVSAAATPILNNANQRLNRQTSIANSLIGMAGRMAASGIYGGAISSVKASASKAASMAAHSAPLALDIDMSPQAVQDRINFFKD